MPSHKKKTCALSLQEVCLSYDDFLALKDVSLTIHKGECFGLIGINGAGKTSFIKAVLGFRHIQSGTMSFFDGLDMTEAKKKIAFLPEKFEPSWFLTGIEFLKLSMKLYKQNYNEKRILSYADDLQLDHEALKRSVGTYSKGMKQKLGLLSVVLSGADFLILDEPMSGLDPAVRAQVKKLLKTIIKEKRTILISSHFLDEVQELCDRVALVHNQKIDTIDTLPNLLKKTNTTSLESCFLKMIAA